MIYGNIEGIRESQLNELERLYSMEFARDEFLPDRLLSLLVRFTQALNREIMVYLGRDGSVLEIAIGSASNVGLPELHLRRNTERLAGFRCIHTHPGGDARLSIVDEQALRLLRFDAMCAIGVGEQYCTGITAAFLGEVEYGRLSIVTYRPVKPGRIPHKTWLREIELAEERVGRAIAEGGTVENAGKGDAHLRRQRRFPKRIGQPGGHGGHGPRSRACCKSAPNPILPPISALAKRQSCNGTRQAMEIDMAIVDDEISAAQQRNLEKILGVDVLDRTALILNIFRPPGKNGGRQATSGASHAQIPPAAPGRAGRVAFAHGFGREPAHARSRRNQAGTGPPHHSRPHRRPHQRAKGAFPPAGHAPRAPRKAGRNHRGAGGLHQRGQIHATQRAFRRGRLCGG